MFDIIIMAGGQGKRMCSSLPKVLHQVAGKPMLERVIETAESLKPQQIHVIIGHHGDVIKQQLAHKNVNWVWQHEQLGTGHAIQQALPHIPHDRKVLILSGDVPLITHATLNNLITQCRDHIFGIFVAQHPNPDGMGRILRVENNQVYAIVEEKDATPEQKQITEIYTGICYVDASALSSWLPLLSNNNAQKEYYLTEIIALSNKYNCPVNAVMVDSLDEIQGVNDRLQLQTIERAYQLRLANDLLMSGVTISDANRLDIRGSLTCGMDVSIDVNNVFQGKVTVDANTYIAPNCLLTNVTIGKNCQILSNSVLENCVIGDNCVVGPFARLRPGTKLDANCKIGNFVETKNAVFKQNSKASHLSYLGDVSIG